MTDRQPNTQDSQLKALKQRKDMLVLQSKQDKLALDKQINDLKMKRLQQRGQRYLPTIRAKNKV